MNGVHDMGGMDGFGPVQPEENEPVFHEPWEGRVLAMNRAMGYSRAWNGDISRYAKEILPPDVYLASSYYCRWTLGLEQMLMDHGLVDSDEFAAGHALHPGKPLKQKLTMDELENALTRRGSYERPAKAPALFGLGDRVRAKNIHPKGHTRLPRYVRGHIGVIERVHGCKREGVGRSLGTIPGAGVTWRSIPTRPAARKRPLPAFPATTMARCSANLGKRKLSP
jgi:nitrile hydratase